MGLKEIVGSIIFELKNLQNGPGLSDLNAGMPGFIDTGNNGALFVNDSIERSIDELSMLLLKNDNAASRQFSNSEWKALVRKTLGPVLVSIDLDDPAAVELVRSELRKRLDSERLKYGDREYAVGCTLFRSDDSVDPIRIGPVLIETRDNWLDRMGAERKIDQVMAKRMKRKWSGGKLTKRKKIADQVMETMILEVVGGCPFVCSVQTKGLPPKGGEQKAMTAARMALATIALAWARPSSSLDGFRLRIDRSLRSISVLSFEPQKKTIPGMRLSHSPVGPSLQTGEWSETARQMAPIFKAAGEVLDFVTHSTGSVARPKLSNVLMQAMLWFHEACREQIDAMAVVKFVAVLDGLACGNGEQAIRSLLRARVGWKDNDNLFKKGNLTMKQAVSRLYGEGRSRTVHGTSERLSHDWSEMRTLAEIVSRIALLKCLFWFASQTSSDHPDDLRAA